MFRSQIRKEIENIVPGDTVFSVERSENPEHGDYSGNAALVLAKKVGKNPRKVAEELKAKLKNKSWEVNIAGPGFLNFFISHEALLAKLENFLDKNSRRGRAPAASAGRDKEFLDKKFSSKKINLEFVSANPTGPLTMANGRGGFYGDVLANVLSAAGHKVTREYFINDAGNQIKLLGESILAAEGKIEPREEYYKGDYIKKLKGKSAEAAAKILLGEIQKSLKKAGIKFDVWFSEEKNLRKKGELKETLEFLNKKEVLKEKEGALWWDERVVIKSNNEPTYLLSDLAYHRNKFLKRKFDTAITIVGADHHAEIKQVEEKVKIFGIGSERLKIIIMQLVRLTSGGKEARMSKRAGEFVTLDDLLKKVGLDAARWFFLERSPDTHMDFDLDLAKERSKKNPVYYVQYAHARACSILRKGGNSSSQPTPLNVRGGGERGGVTLNLLKETEELNLIKKILQLPEVIEDIAEDYQVHRLPRYAYELAQVFTNFYEKHHVIDVKNLELTKARLALVDSAQKTLKSTLALMGIAAPAKM